jgi:hypothetical protein
MKNISETSFGESRLNYMDYSKEGQILRSTFDGRYYLISVSMIITHELW